MPPHRPVQFVKGSGRPSNRSGCFTPLPLRWLRRYCFSKGFTCSAALGAALALSQHLPDLDVGQRLPQSAPLPLHLAAWTPNSLRRAIDRLCVIVLRTEERTQAEEKQHPDQAQHLVGAGSAVQEKREPTTGPEDIKRQVSAMSHTLPVFNCFLHPIVFCGPRRSISLD